MGDDKIKKRLRRLVFGPIELKADLSPTPNLRLELLNQGNVLRFKEGCNE